MSDLLDNQAAAGRRPVRRPVGDVRRLDARPPRRPRARRRAGRAGRSAPAAPPCRRGSPTGSGRPVGSWRPTSTSRGCRPTPRSSVRASRRRRRSPARRPLRPRPRPPRADPRPRSATRRCGGWPARCGPAAGSSSRTSTCRSSRAPVPTRRHPRRTAPTGCARGSSSCSCSAASTSRWAARCAGGCSGSASPTSAPRPTPRWPCRRRAASRSPTRCRCAPALEALGLGDDVDAHLDALAAGTHRRRHPAARHGVGPAPLTRRPGTDERPRSGGGV